MSVYYDETLQSVIVGSQDLSVKEQILTDFKAHVKRDFVNLQYVPSNFEALVYAVSKYPHQEIGAIAFSTICHLVKRVSIQDYTVLKICYSKVIPCLIQNLVDQKPSVKAAARKALHVYWTCCPSEVDDVIKHHGLHSSLESIKEQCLLFLISICEQQPQNFLFKPFTSTVVSFLRPDSSRAARDQAIILLTKFFKNSQSKNAKSDLVNELVKQNITRAMVNQLLSEIDASLIAEYSAHFSYQDKLDSMDQHDLSEKFINSGSVRITAGGINSNNTIPMSKSKSYQNLKAKNSQTRLRPTQVIDASYDQVMANSNNDSSMHSITGTSHSTSDRNPELELFLSKLPGYQLENITGISISRATDLKQDVEDLLRPFMDKETEFNWSIREKNIIYMRTVLRGNAPIEFPEAVAQFFRALCDAISKAVNSLRTSLSSNGCQLIKEMATFLGGYMDSITIDVCTTVLLKLSSATKKIASQNAMIAFSCLIANISHHSRVFNAILNAAHDKNVQPRLYSGTWLHIYMLKNQNSLAIGGHQILDQLEKTIMKCLSDPNPTVRESMRNTFWCFYQYWPSRGDVALAKLDLSTKKALERSRPLIDGNKADMSKSPKKRQSIRELIVAKNRTNGTPPPASGVANTTTRHPYVPRSQSSGSGSGSQKDLGKPVRFGSQNQSISRSMSLKNRAGSGVARSRSEEVRQHSKDSSIKDIFNRSPSIELPPAEMEDAGHKDVERPKSSSSSASSSAQTDAMRTPSFEQVQEDDMIIKLLRSDSSDFKIEAVSLLKYAFISGETIDPAVDGLLDSLSINEPQLLKPLYDPEILSEAARHLQPDNFLRSYIVSLVFEQDLDDLPEFDDNLITCLVDAITVEVLYSTGAQLLNVANNISLVVNEKLVMQFIRYKRLFFNCVIRMWTKLLQTYPITDMSYGKILDVLFQAVDFFQSLETEDEVEPYVRVLSQLRTIKPQLFDRRLDAYGEKASQVIRSFTRLDKNQKNYESDYEDALMTEDFHVSSLSEMTMIQPRTNLSASSSLHDFATAANDMTMIMPNLLRRSSSAGSFNSVKETVHEEDEHDDSIFNHHGLNFQKAAKEELDKSHTYEDTERMVQDHHESDHQESDDQSPPSSSSHDLISQIENVNISSPPVASEEYKEPQREKAEKGKKEQEEEVSKIETVINQLDPFAALTGAHQSVQIYEDQVSDSHHKDTLIYPRPGLDPYSDSESWYQFQLQKYCSLDIKSPIEMQVIDDLKNRSLSNTATNEDWSVLLLVVYQSDKWLVSIEELVKIISTTEQGIEAYLNSIAILVHNLKIAKEAISETEMNTLWDVILYQLSYSCDYFANEMWFAVTHLIFELMAIDHSVLMSKLNASPLDNSKQVSVALIAIKILVTDGDLFDALAQEDVTSLINFCNNYLCDSSVEIRKTVVTILGMISKLDQDRYAIFDESTKKLSSQQHRLVEEFAV